MSIAKDTREFAPGHVFHEEDETTLYWISDGKIMYRHYPVRGADAESFRFYLGSFGKDRTHCYCTFSRLTGGVGSKFRALNYTFATDGKSVWTLGGRIKDADAKSFVVCDDGEHYLDPETRVPHGFGKDQDRVFYYDYDGKPNWVRKADAASFVSLNDGYFGHDRNFVFFGAATIPKAKVRQWRKLGGLYSRDDSRVYYLNREIREADCDSFKFLKSGGLFYELAKDKLHYYCSGRIIDAAEYADRRKAVQASRRIKKGTKARQGT
ncbi:MAG: DKNYY domain-containing protein [Thermoguttaceae bacterium]|jgi:hypothetical protein